MQTKTVELTPEEVDVVKKSVKLRNFNLDEVLRNNEWKDSAAVISSKERHIRQLNVGEDILKKLNKR